MKGYKLIIVLSAVQSAIGARILCIFPTPSFSHQIVFRPLVKELSRRGHTVIVGTTDPTHTQHPNITEFDWSFLYKEWENLLNFNKMGEGRMASTDIFLLFSRVAAVVIDLIFSTPEMQKIIRNESEEFDLLMVEYYCFPAIFSLATKLHVPLIGVTSMDLTTANHDLVGNIPHFLQYPDIHFDKTIIPITFYERLHRVYFAVGFRYVYRYVMMPAQEKIMKKYFGKHYELKDIRPELVLVNAHPALGFSRSVVPTHIDVTGIHMEDVKPLPQEIKTYLDGAEHGAVIFSLGTNVKSALLPLEIKEILVRGFAELPYRFIMKWNSEEFTDLPDNVKSFQWLPQNDILGHPNIKLFIFQGGYQSMVESVTHAVPMIGIPFFGDQFLNVEKILHYEIGLKWDLATMTEDILKKSITACIRDVKYKNNVLRMSKQLYDAPQSPLERAVWWTEYVIRNNGTNHLKPLVPQLPWIQFLYLDIIIFLLCTLLIAVIILYYTGILVKRFWRILITGRHFKFCRKGIKINDTKKD